MVEIVDYVESRCLSVLIDDDDRVSLSNPESRFQRNPSIHNFDQKPSQRPLRAVGIEYIPCSWCFGCVLFGGTAFDFGIVLAKDGERK